MNIAEHRIIRQQGLQRTGFHRIFCVAASTGGIETISTLLSALPKDFPGSIFVTQHIGGTDRRCYLAELFARGSDFECQLANQPMPIRPSTVYVAAPGFHLLIDREMVYPAMGPRENYARPAADPMFRSAAVHHGSSVVGVVLTGFLDDGTAGLAAIKHCGGKALVQDPTTAIAPDMPLSAVDHCEVDAVLPIDELADRMVQLSKTEAGPSYQPTRSLLEELEFAHAVKSDILAEQKMGELSPFMCPDCGGQMWRMEDPTLPRFRCHVGHAHSLRSLANQHGDSVERMGWALLRTLKEREKLLLEMARHESEIGRQKSAGYYQNRSEECHQQLTAVQHALRLTGDPSDRGKLFDQHVPDQTGAEQPASTRKPARHQRDLPDRSETPNSPNAESISTG